MTLVYTYSNLNTFKNVCPHQFFRRYVKKDIKFVESEAIKWGNEVHTAFEHRVVGGKPLPLPMQQWEHFAKPLDGRGARCEVKLGITREGKSCDYWAKDVWLRGKVDVVVANGDAAIILDWKTGSSKFESSFELEVGALLLKAQHPALDRIAGRYVWLKEDRLGQDYDLSNTQVTFHNVHGIVSEIEQGGFVKRPSGLCGWCDVMDCEHNKKGK